MEQFYSIAGLVVKMDTFGRTLKQAEPYVCSAAEPDMVIHADWKALQQSNPHLSADDSEYILTGLHFYHQLLAKGGIMLHASAVVVDGEAYLFSAPSGTGKSTHTALWLKCFGERAFLLNDDKPALRLEDGKWYAYGTPWSGKEALNTNYRAPLKGICFLSRGEQNRIAPFTGANAIRSFLEQTVRPGAENARIRIMELLDALFRAVPVWKMECNMELDAARLAFETMSRHTEKEN